MQRQIVKMKDYWNDQKERILTLEQYCKTYDGSNLRVGVESLKDQGGDEAYLCLIDNNQLIGFISWYTSDGVEANINGMVHPDFRRQGVFKDLLRRVMSEMQLKGIQTCCLRIPSNSEPGLGFIKHVGANFHTSEFSMNINSLLGNHSKRSGLSLRSAKDQDIEFMVTCSSQAFGDSEAWTRNYFARTREPERVTFIALANLKQVGMVRVNHLNKSTAVIHDLCVLPSLQGKGYGREILTGIVQLLQEQKCSDIRLGVVTENRRALNLYQSLGFEISAEFQYYVIPINKLMLVC